MLKNKNATAARQCEERRKLLIHHNSGVLLYVRCGKIISYLEDYPFETIPDERMKEERTCFFSF